MPVITIQHLEKYYGKNPGARDVTFSVEQGEIFGFVGPNGAGKSTTIKVLMGFIFASGGSAAIGGLDVARDSKKIKAFTGYVPSDVRLYPALRVEELLRRNAAFYGGGFEAETQRLCRLFEVDGHKHFHELSTGNKKKVSIVCALMAAPRVVILDEPTSGLDPVMQRKLFEELEQQTQKGATVLLSSHNLAEVQEYCHRVAFIKEGKILAVRTVADTQLQQIVTVQGARVLPVQPGLEKVADDGEKQVFRTALPAPALLAALAEMQPQHFTVENESMEDQFWNLYGGEETA